MASIQVRIRYNVIACSYPWRESPNPGSTTPPRFPEYWPAWGDRNPQTGRWVARPQNTPEYGRYVLGLCKQYAVTILSGYWSGHGADLDTLRHFKESFWNLPLADFGDVRLAFNFETSFGPARLENAILQNLPDLGNPRYARITDANGQRRPLILLWGNTAKDWPADFRALIGRVRDRCVSTLGLEPFILPTQHLIHLNRPEFFESVDGFYRHSFELVPNTHRTTAQATGQVENLWNLERSLLANRRQPRTGLPLLYVPGVMPQFAKGEKDGPFYKNHGGWVEAKSKAEVIELYRRMRNYAGMGSFRLIPTGPISFTIEIESWVAVTSWNEWPESSCLEPCWAEPVGDGVYRYGRDFLEALLEIFGPGAESPKPLAPLWDSLLFRWRKIGEQPQRPAVPDAYDLRFGIDGTFTASQGSATLEQGQVLGMTGDQLRLWSVTRKLETIWRVSVTEQGNQLSIENVADGFTQIFRRLLGPSPIGPES